jgi:hypothetical protein
MTYLLSKKVCNIFLQMVKSMASDRSVLIEALHEVPADLAAMLTATFGNVASVSVPTTVDESLIVQGKVAAAFNNAILRPLSGLPIVQLALRIGQNNPTNMAMLLSMLKVSGSLGKNTFQVSWTDGATYALDKIPPLSVTPNGRVSAVSGELSGPKNLEFDCDKGEESDVWTATPAIEEAGEYTLTVAVTFLDVDDPKSQSLSVTITTTEEQDEPQSD